MLMGSLVRPADSQNERGRKKTAVLACVCFESAMFNIHRVLSEKKKKKRRKHTLTHSAFVCVCACELTACLARQPETELYFCGLWFVSCCGGSSDSGHMSIEVPLVRASPPASGFCKKNVKKLTVEANERWEHSRTPWMISNKLQPVESSICLFPISLAPLKIQRLKTNFPSFSARRSRYRCRCRGVIVEGTAPVAQSHGPLRASMWHLAQLVSTTAGLNRRFLTSRRKKYFSNISTSNLFDDQRATREPQRSTKINKFLKMNDSLSRRSLMR